MPTRLAGALALIAFALCIVLGLGAGNTFATTVSRALVAMAGTFVLGLILGAVAQKMLDENLKAEEDRLKNQSSPPPGGR